MKARNQTKLERARRRIEYIDVQAKIEALKKKFNAESKSTGFGVTFSISGIIPDVKVFKAFTYEELLHSDLVVLEAYIQFEIDMAKAKEQPDAK